MGWRRCVRFELGSAGLSSFIDEIPEVLGIRQRFVLSHRELGAEQEIRKGAPVKNAVHHHLVAHHFEVKTPLAGTEPVERFPVALDLTETFVLEMFEVAACDLEFVEQGQLLQSIQLRDFGGTDFVEDDL